MEKEVIGWYEQGFVLLVEKGLLKQQVVDDCIFVYNMYMLDLNLNILLVVGINLMSMYLVFVVFVVGLSVKQVKVGDYLFYISMVYDGMIVDNLCYCFICEQYVLLFWDLKIFDEVLVWEVQDFVKLVDGILVFIFFDKK